MNPLLIVPIIDSVGKIFDRIFPDKTAADKAKAELMVLSQTQEFQRDIAQINVNAEEAKSSNILISGWRPFIGWTCGTAFALHFVIFPVMNFALVAFGQNEITITFDMATLLTVLGGLLGLGGLRTVEKIKGVVEKH